MAKRKAARRSEVKAKAGRASGNRAKKAAKKTTRRPAARSAKKAAPSKARRAASSKTVRKRTVASSRGAASAAKRAKATVRIRRKAVKKRASPAPKAAAKRAATAKATARKAAVAMRLRRAAAAKPSAKPVATRRRTSSADTATPRKAPALNRARRVIQDDDDIVQTPPSSLDLDRSASAVRTGRREMKERYDQHTETSPALTAGDVDADWESAYSVGDEAPGGDNPTPDQDIVDDIGKAVGVQYDDNEELKGEKKISDRDAHRWELDPASAEDYNEHDQD
jgi:hypothetical protein